MCHRTSKLGQERLAYHPTCALASASMGNRTWMWVCKTHVVHVSFISRISQAIQNCKIKRCRYHYKSNFNWHLYWKPAVIG